MRAAQGPSLRAGAGLDALEAVWARSDALFDLVAEDALYERPIPLRQPFVFYLGHLPAFAWNTLGRGLLGLPPFRPELDALFERGIDPIGVDAVPAAEWPSLPEVDAYRLRVREVLATALPGAGAARRDEALAMVLEHERMHHETLLYMMQELPAARKRRPPGLRAEPPLPAARIGPLPVPGGRVVLGRRRGRGGFGWDNEFPEHVVEVADFVIDGTPVTNGDYLAFVSAGGYEERRFWRPEDWDWRERLQVRHPRFWRYDGGRVRYRRMFDDVPLEAAAAWPVAVSWAEAAAYARWRGARLPSEAELHRAAYGAPEQHDRRWPWGDAAPEPGRHGNFDFARWSPAPVGAYPEGASAWGVRDLIGNGWEWTGTPFGPFPGFEPMPGYPGYSRDFFDGRHFVLLGGSWATATALLRRSFRNWFQPHYPYVFSQFRCVTAG